MIRAFETHRIRKTRELSSSLWTFYPLSGEHAGRRRLVPVPGCWESWPDTRTYRGKAIYERSFEAEGNIRLVFKGVSHTAKIFLDGKQIASHYNAYTPFEALVTGLADGTHTLKVEVDNSYSPASTLHIPNDYQSYGGITRSVVLEMPGDVFISKIHFTPFRKSTADMWYGAVRCSLHALTDEPVSGTLVLNLNGREICSLPVCLRQQGEQTIAFPVLAFPGIKAWSPGDPQLYELQAIFRDSQGNAVDDLIERIGFREIAVDGRRLLLNGEPFLIRGFCRHEDHPDFGCAIPFQIMYEDLSMMKDMGANAVRTVHYPNDELFLDLCDELGMLVWEEGHARGLTQQQMQSGLFLEQSLTGIREMVEAHYNHPSIGIWGFLNECASDTLFGKDCYQKHYDLLRSLDPSRPSSFATCAKGTDLCLGIPDIVSFNLYPEWYEPESADVFFTKLLCWIEEETQGSGKPFLITETGADALYGYRTPYHVKWSEEYQQTALRNQLTAVSRLVEERRCIGVFLWQFCDVRVSDEWFFSRPRTMNNKGIVDEYRRPKLAYDTIKELWNDFDALEDNVHFS